MALESKLCLICDDVAVIEVISLQMQTAPLCGVHWLDYCANEGGVTADEVRKYFDDGAHGDVPKPLPYVIEHGVSKLKTDETPGDYRTDEQETG